MKVVILHDQLGPNARADELDVLVQARAVGDALQSLGHDSVTAAFSADLPALTRELRRHSPDVVFNLVESVCGSGRLIYLAPAWLDTLHIPYTGADTEAMFVTSNKVLAKRLLSAGGIPTPPFWTPGAGGDLPASGRYVIKSVWEEASLGLEDDSVVQPSSTDELRHLVLNRSAALGGAAFAELYIHGREFNLSVLDGPEGPQVLPPAEIHFVDYDPGRPRLVGYRAKWDPQSFEYHHTPRCFDFHAVDQPLLDELRRLALCCWNLFGLRGYARADFRVDAAGQPWVLEVNANPCLSPDAGFVAAAERGGLSFEQVIARILAA